MQEAIQDNLRKIRNFIGFARGFMIRKNPLKKLLNDCVMVIKDIFSVNQKKKLARYRVNATMYKLKRLEETIAENNEHTFLRGKKLNEMR